MNDSSVVISVHSFIRVSSSESKGRCVRKRRKGKGKEEERRKWEGKGKGKEKRKGGKKRAANIRSGVTESRDVDSHVSGQPQTGSSDQVTLRQLHTIASHLDAYRCLLW